jgi:hypothetical protein
MRLIALTSTQESASAASLAFAKDIAFMSKFEGFFVLGRGGVRDGRECG